MNLRPRICVVVCLALAACGGPSFVVDYGPPPGRDVGALPPSTDGATLRAGAARVDITPNPGIPMGGWGPAGRIARGSWMPLYARATYLSDRADNELVIVVCDLWSMAGGLADSVAARVRQNPSTEGLDRSEMLICATHTHQSPAHFSSYSFYNAHASIAEGFDSELFSFLVDRIARSIIEAHDRAVPARAVYHSTIVPTLERNRSIEPFWMNREAASILATNEPRLPIDGERPYAMDSDVYRALDPTLHTIRIDRTSGAGAPIAVLSFVSVHPTAMGPSLELYSGDIFGLATIACDQIYASEDHVGSATVVSIVNGTEGDVSANWHRQDRRNALRLARCLADSILTSAHEAGEELAGGISGRFDRISMQDRQVIDSNGRLKWIDRMFSDPALAAHWTSQLPSIGVGAVGGAEDGRTTYSDLGSVEGVYDQRAPATGSKEIEWKLNTITRPFNKVVNLLGRLEPEDVPKEIPLAVYRWGGIMLAALPGEPTTVVGRRIIDRLQQIAPDERPIVVSMANDYISYFSTPEEYDLQHYEGASNIFGPASSPLLEVEIARLAKSLGSRVERGAAERARYSPGDEYAFTIDNVGSSPWTPTEGLATVVQGITGRPRHDFPQFVWTAPAGERFPTIGAEDDAGVIPRVTILVENAGTFDTLRVAPLVRGGAYPTAAVEDNRGSNIVTIALDARKDSVRWCAIWMVDSLASDRRYRFNVQSHGGEAIASEPFDRIAIASDPILIHGNERGAGAGPLLSSTQPGGTSVGADNSSRYLVPLSFPGPTQSRHYLLGVGYEAHPVYYFTSPLTTLNEELATGTPLPVVIRHGVTMMGRIDIGPLAKTLVNLSWDRAVHATSQTVELSNVRMSRRARYEESGFAVGIGRDLLNAAHHSLYIRLCGGWRDYQTDFSQFPEMSDTASDGFGASSIAGERLLFEHGSARATELVASAIPVSLGFAYTFNTRVLQLSAGVDASYGPTVRGWQTTSGIRYTDMPMPAGLTVGGWIGVAVGIFVP